MMPNTSEEVSSSKADETGTVLKKGPWTASEDAILMEYVKEHGEGNWNSVQKKTRLSRCGKSCRLRWANHLRPDLKKGSFSLEEEHIILDLHAKYGNKWARMASQLPGRTDNEIKNYWNTRIKRRQRSNLPLYSLHKQAPKFQFSQHQNHQVHHSQSSPIQFASSYPMKHYHQSPLSLYNPVGISRTIPLRTPQFPQQFHGRYSPYQVPINRFTPASYNFNEPNPMHSNSIQTPFNPDGLAPPHCSNFSMKLELPSNQSQQTADYSGLLDALLQESDAMAASKNNSRIEEKCTLNFGFDFNDTDMDQLLESASQIDVTDFADCLTGLETKKEQILDDVDSIKEESSVSMFLQTTPSPISLNEDIGNDLQELVSSIQSVSTSADHDWTLGTWNNMPEIC